LGTEEPGGIPAWDLDRVKEEVGFYSRELRPDFIVLQTGSLVRDGYQVGRLRRKEVIQAGRIVRGEGIRVKEHNADFLTDQDLWDRSELFEAVNIAPELGALQTELTLEMAKERGISTEAWEAEVFLGRK